MDDLGWERHVGMAPRLTMGIGFYCISRALTVQVYHPAASLLNFTKQLSLSLSLSRDSMATGNMFNLRQQR